jgi:hypothetical protein
MARVRSPPVSPKGAMRALLVVRSVYAVCWLMRKACMGGSRERQSQANLMGLGINKHVDLNQQLLYDADA